MEETKYREKEELARQISYYRSKLMPYAYNILGDRMGAEDVVQDVLNKHFLSAHEHIKNRDNYLIKSIINRSINEKNLLRNRKEEYPGPWLPAPVLTEESIYKDTDRDYILNYSLLVLLENLNARERAVFILKEAFDLAHAEIAEMLDIHVDHSRQLLRRSRQKIKPEAVRESHSAMENREVLEDLTSAILEADLQRVKQLLSGDIQTLSDGGDKARAARNIISGQENVYKLMKANYGKYFPEGTKTRMVTVNHYPAILYCLDEKVFRCTVFEIRERHIHRIYIIVNPDKLKSLEPFPLEP